MRIFTFLGIILILLVVFLCHTSGTAHAFLSTTSVVPSLSQQLRQGQQKRQQQQHQQHQQQHQQRTHPWHLSAHSLNTAFEWLADDRENNDPAYSSITWLDPAAENENSMSVSLDDSDSENDESSMVQIMPLYPIGATYLPSQTTHFLNNMEPRNVQMAIDLERQRSSSSSSYSTTSTTSSSSPTTTTTKTTNKPLFCVVLAAADTGRIASVGTVMEVVDTELQRVDSDQKTIQKIRVTCRPIAAVDIQTIVNPNAASWKSRLCKSPEYLKARVKYRHHHHPHQEDMTDRNIQTEKAQKIIDTILQDYNVVRDFYLRGVVGTTDHLPPYAVDHLLESLPPWTTSNFETATAVWSTMEQWQTLCNTVRDHQQSVLSTELNEIMIAAASARGGPLQLPVHPRDLSPQVQRQLQRLEVEAQQKFCQDRNTMDPCLDFQVLLGLSSPEQKLEFFSKMILRERQRIETALEQKQAQAGQEQAQNPPVLLGSPLEGPQTPQANKSKLQRGAWFDDSAWDPPATTKTTTAATTETMNNVGDDAMSFNATSTTTSTRSQ